MVLTAPIVRSSTELPEGYARSGLAPMLAIADDRAYVVMNESVAVVAIADPRAPRVIGEIDAPGDPSADEPFAGVIDVAASSGYLAVTTWDGVCLAPLASIATRRADGCLQLGPGAWTFAGRAVAGLLLEHPLSDVIRGDHQGIAYAVIEDANTAEAWVSVSKWLTDEGVRAVRLLEGSPLGVAATGLLSPN